MEIFRLFESTMANVQPGPSIKHLRRDQLLDNYEAAAKTLQTLIKAKESEITYRRDLIKMLEDSKAYHDAKLLQAKQEYQTAKSHIPENIDLKSNASKPASLNRSTTPPLPPPSQVPHQLTTTPSSVASSHSSSTPIGQSYAHPIPTTASQSSTKSSDSDFYAHDSDNTDQKRGSLDRRLSEFLKTFPNLTQTGLAPPSNLDQQQLQQHQHQSQQHQQHQFAKPTPGYYTQQPPIPTIPVLAAPPSIELLRFPPPFFPRNDRNAN
jgi:hypothetical protein